MLKITNDLCEKLGNDLSDVRCSFTFFFISWNKILWSTKEEKVFIKKDE